MRPTAVYVLQCEEGAWYVGMSNHPYRRFIKHCEWEGSYYTRHYTPLRIAHVWWYPTRARAEYMEEAMTALLRDHALKVGGGLRTVVGMSGRGKDREPSIFVLAEELEGRIGKLYVAHINSRFMRGKTKAGVSGYRRSKGWLIKKGTQ